jgi:Na+-transporting NADH:ubiquinone oxidoreductase subunit NqrB
MFTTGGGAFSAYTAITGLLVGGIVGFTKAVWSFVTGGASFGIAFAVTVGVGAAILGQQAQGYLNQEEADLA